MEFQYFESFYNTALDCAKENDHQEIVTLLSNGPIQTTTSAKGQQPKIENDVCKITTSNSTNSELDELKTANLNLNKENSELKKRNSRLEIELSRIKSFLSAFKERQTQLESVQINEYEEISVIGEGGQSTVKKVCKKEEFAKKELKQFDHKSLQRFLHESEILVQLRHPCIIRIIGFDYGNSSHPPSIFLTLEPTSLEESIQAHQLANEEKNRITVEIVLGMRYIHSNNLIHRDLKPNNILLSKNKHVRISDFGLTKEEDSKTSLTKGVGTLQFMAPELVDEDENEEDANENEMKAKEPYNSKVDVYSFGIILIYIITERYPKYSLRNKLNGIPPKLPSTILPWVSELIHRCLQLSPSERPTFNEIFDILKSHDFDLFNETKSSKPTIQQIKSKEEINHRILKIEAFEYQHRL